MLAIGPDWAIESVEVHIISQLFNLTLREAKEWIDSLHVILGKERGEQVNLCEFCTYHGFDIDILIPDFIALTGY
ncbi:MULTISPECIES: hypothetical protein [Chitinophaga]|uniref:hypothetical protein n=1 Tax=Chitinophaga TaxID=79328 RepID=UPI0009CCB8CE|nr:MULTISPECIES: hypothetical protein [Chitinophaga]OMP76391.1 hypothetical protein BW716_25110 [[Flexibacter] sp. ATCC 35208]WPQ65928.1 hypothetical protein SIO70_13790 [Chitinophaga sancti]WPV70381.1 hypothetical protein QQL36_16865 [Chitinophaga sp. LS1]